MAIKLTDSVIEIEVDDEDLLAFFSEKTGRQLSAKDFVVTQAEATQTDDGKRDFTRFTIEQRNN